jgi:hypothetical protein
VARCYGHPAMALPTSTGQHSRLPTEGHCSHATNRLRAVLVPFTVDPPEWCVFNSRFGGGGARAGARTSLGRAVVPRVYRREIESSVSP